MLLLYPGTLDHMHVSSLATAIGTAAMGNITACSKQSALPVLKNSHEAAFLQVHQAPAFARTVLFSALTQSSTQVVTKQATA